MNTLEILMAGLIVAGVAGFFLYRKVAHATPSGWYFGPIIKGKNWSKGMPKRPDFTPDPSRILEFEMPVGIGAEVDYLVGDPITLTGKDKLLFAFDYQGPEPYPVEGPSAPATATICLMRRGDNWSAKGKYEHYRWYQPTPLLRIKEGKWAVELSLTEGEWTNVFGRKAKDYPEQFDACLKNLGNIAICFGTRRARGHGVRARDAGGLFTLIKLEAQ